MPDIIENSFFAIVGVLPLAMLFHYSFADRLSAVVPDRPGPTSDDSNDLGHWALPDSLRTYLLNLSKLDYGVDYW